MTEPRESPFQSEADISVLHLRQALWDVYWALGFDTDRAATPVGVAELGAVVLRAAQDFRRDYDELQDAEGATQATLGITLQRNENLRAEVARLKRLRVCVADLLDSPHPHGFVQKLAALEHVWRESYGTCTCGQSWKRNVVHRSTGSCYLRATPEGTEVEHETDYSQPENQEPQGPGRRRAVRDRRSLREEGGPG